MKRIHHILSLVGTVAFLLCQSTVTHQTSANSFSQFLHNMKHKLSKQQSSQHNDPLSFSENANNKLQATPQECQSNQYLINNIDFPYWNTADQFPCMYAGTFDTSTSKEKNHNLFFWMIKNTQMDITTEKPNLIIQLNGDPGTTSLHGLFMENGPLEVTGTSPEKDDYVVSLRKGGFSWGDLGDILYLDNPVGTGFSYSGEGGEDYISSTEEAGQEFVKFLSQFIEMFPEYQKKNGRVIYLVGKSDGKFVSAFSKYADDLANTIDDKFTIKGIVLGSPLISPPLQKTKAHHLPLALGILDDKNLEQIHTLNKNCEENLSNDKYLWRDDPKAMVQLCEQPINYIGDISGGRLKYDARLFNYDYDPIAQVYLDFLGNSKKKAQLYKSLHIEKSTKNPIFSGQLNSKVSENLAAIVMQDSNQWVDQIMNIGYDFMIYAGEWDQTGNGPTNIENFLKESRRAQMSPTKVWNQPKQIYYYESNEDKQLKVGGYYKYDDFNKLTVLTLAKAGHFTTGSSQEAIFNAMKDFMTASHKPLCHKGTGGDECSIVPIMCKYMAECNKPNGQCQENGQCKCVEGFKSADCSEKAELLTASYSKQFITNGTQWQYFYYKNGLLQNLYHELTLSSQQPLDIYISAGWESDPNDFSYELAFKKLNYIKISSQQFPSLDTFTLTVKINGINHYANIFHTNTLNVKFDVRVNTQIPKDILHKDINENDILSNKQNEKNSNVNHIQLEQRRPFNGNHFNHNKQNWENGQNGGHHTKEYHEKQYSQYKNNQQDSKFEGIFNADVEFSHEHDINRNQDREQWRQNHHKKNQGNHNEDQNNNQQQQHNMNKDSITISGIFNSIVDKGKNILNSEYIFKTLILFAIIKLLIMYKNLYKKGKQYQKENYDNVAVIDNTLIYDIKQ